MEEDFPQHESAAVCMDLITTAGLLEGDSEKAFATIHAMFKRALPDSAIPDLLEGQFYTHYAWEARGDGWASTVTDEGWRLLRERLQRARAALLRGYKIDPKEHGIARQMLSIELGDSRGRAAMETWFRRAVATDPDDIKSYSNKAYYLTPKWHGSVQDQLDFGRECLATKRWDSRIPFVLLDTHDHLTELVYREEDLSTDTDEVKMQKWQVAQGRFYRTTPGVWGDAQKLYEGFLAAHPEAIYDRTKYAQLAMIAGHPEIAQKQLGLLGNDVATCVFGTAEDLAKFRAAVEAAVSKASSATQAEK